VLVESDKPTMENQLICNATDDKKYSPDPDLTFRGKFSDNNFWSRIIIIK